MATEYKTQLFINNEYVAAKSGEKYSLYNPSDETLVSDSVAIAGQEDVDAAVAGAKAAYKGEWASTSGAQRGRLMSKVADLFEEQALALGNLEHVAMGQPAGIAAFMIKHMADVFRYYGGWADKIAGETFPADDGTYKIVRYEALGVCAGVGAWNASPMAFAWKVAPALAAGNTVVYKGSEKSPLGVLAYGAVFKAAGFPAGVVQLLSGPGSTGALLASHMDIAKISFTGSAPVGRKIQDMANNSNMKRVTLELGGKSPALVFDDADIDNAVAYCSNGFLLNSGQVCAAASRTYVQESIAPKFLAALKARFEAAQQAMLNGSDNPMEQLGPMADRLQYERVMAFIEAGKSEAELVTGGARCGSKGLFVQPTLFLNPKPDATIYKQEIFGPVNTVRTFKTEDEAIALANDTTYGLSAAVYTQNVARALRVSAALETGTVSVNSSHMPTTTTPFGGVKQSGQGSELGRPGLMAYLNPKTIHIKYVLAYSYNYPHPSPSARTPLTPPPSAWPSKRTQPHRTISGRKDKTQKEKARKNKRKEKK
ncbi:uncharacterized protein K452DRAFT_283020 [Aplosporella prunicola CBS 121167]|uniref:aldehyde dehydrogenase (NAD(+)) n=1 Tax=Aplosporella prunicola CBS 121167 TaxID=1176127 RepID=A0A6A6BSN1_9PEZI|nr:uncharacterized protein K452DRAFT_283020 [Aplosporella prunicola CBS 121167]KAF2146818.1 hypothetical protein K452DRAFT_283020 [Aplosporella prunicola CBS 121167]